VARAAGVGRTTAQRALSNSPRCAAQTRRKVLQAARRLGYKPQPVFAAMGARSRKRLMGDLPLAYLEATDGPRRAGGAYFEPARVRAAALGYQLDRIDLDRWGAVARLWDVLYARGYAGVLVGGVREEWHPLLLENTRFPVVCCGRVDPLPFHTVRPAILNGVRKAFQEIARRGYRRIGAAVLRHDPPVADDFSRLAAALACLRELGSLHARIPPLDSGLAGGADLRRWLTEYQPDAVLAFHDGILSGIVEAGYRVPTEIAFASLHRDPDRRIAGLDQNHAAIAGAAVNLMDQLIRHGDAGIPRTPLTLLVESTWFDGPTLPRKRSRRALSPGPGGTVSTSATGSRAVSRVRRPAGNPTVALMSDSSATSRSVGTGRARSGGKAR